MYCTFCTQVHTTLKIYIVFACTLSTIVAVLIFVNKCMHACAHTFTCTLTHTRARTHTLTHIHVHVSTTSVLRYGPLKFWNFQQMYTHLLPHIHAHALTHTCNYSTSCTGTRSNTVSCSWVDYHTGTYFTQLHGLWRRLYLLTLSLAFPRWNE